MKQEKLLSKHERMKLEDQAIRQTLEKVKHRILILSGKGGVGKSTIAVNLAVALSNSGKKTGLMDVDLHGPSVPRLLGLTRCAPSSIDGQIAPVRYSENLKVVSVEHFLNESDQAVIWRGPLKIGVIRQFLADVAWEELDYLIIDSPPGTGDEPLTIAQTIPNVKAIIVSTPQEISLADVRKSINFCQAVNLPIIGLIENMAGYICPLCGYHQDIFGAGGGEETARTMGLAFLGKIPIDPDTVAAGDLGRANLAEGDDTPASRAFEEVVKAVEISQEGKAMEIAATHTSEEKKKVESVSEEIDMTIAVPTADGLLASHFGHCEYFILFDIKDSQIVNQRKLEPPPHEPGALPRWLKEQSTNTIIAGGMGSRAQGFFRDFGIEVVIGAHARDPKKIVEEYLAGRLETGENICDH